MISVIILSLNNNLVSLYFQILCIGDHRDSEMLSDLGTNLSGISVDCLTSGDDEVILKISDSACDGGGGCPCISTAENSVSYKDCLVSAHCKCFSECICCLGKSHGKDCNLSAVLILKTKSCLKASLVIGIHDSEHCCSVQGTVGIELNSALCIRNLLYTNYNFHGLYFLSLYLVAGYLRRLAEMTIR